MRIYLLLLSLLLGLIVAFPKAVSAETCIFKVEMLDLPQVPLEDIQAKAVIKINDGRDSRLAEGVGFERIESGFLNGKKVFIKVSSRSAEQVHAEANWYLILNKINLGPKLHGVAVTKDGKYAIVTEYIEGIHFPGVYSPIGTSLEAQGLPLPKGIVISDKTFRSIRRTVQILNAARINGVDLQFRITFDGIAVLVDPEAFLEMNDDYDFLNIKRGEDIIRQLKAIK